MDRRICRRHINLYVTNGKNGAPAPTAVAAQLQHDMQEWEKLLPTTGGKLELSKCFYYILQWKLDEGKPTDTTKEELETMGVTIQVQEAGEAAATKIKHLDCATAHRTLGLHKTPMGNQDEQLKKLQENSARIACAIATSSIT